MTKSARARSTCAAGALSERLRRVSSWRSSAVSGRRGSFCWRDMGHLGTRGSPHHYTSSHGRRPTSVAPGDTVLSALKLMQEKDIGAVVVLEGGKLQGILTERDYAREVELKSKTAKDTLVHQIMTRRPVFYATPGDSVE